MKELKKGKKWLSLLLTVAMLLTAGEIPVSAVGSVDNGGEERAVERALPKNPVHYCTKDQNQDGNNDITKWDYVYFGSYPQTEVRGEELTESIINAEYDENGDALTDGQKYRRIGGTDANHLEYRYFRWEPIKWRVLKNDGSTLFVAAAKGLDCQKYNAQSVSVTWEQSTLRSWLNDTFYHMAFREEEQKDMVMQSVVNENNPDRGTAGGNDTEDNVFLLSIKEATNPEYGFCEEGADYSAGRRVRTSDYVRAVGETKWDSSYCTCYWWLRSPGGEPKYAAYVSSGGYVNNSGENAGMAAYACVPAIRIDISSKLWSPCESGGEPGADLPANPTYDADTNTVKWSYVNFGSYPQTEVVGEALTESIINAEYDENGDAFVNDMKFRRTGEEAGGYRYFQWETIRWRVLENDGKTLFVMAASALDSQSYHEENVNVTWEKSTIRSWLNDTFYHMAFGSGEQEAIVEQNVRNHWSPYTDAGTGNVTKDSIYLLSMEEVTNPEYGFCENFYFDSADRRMRISDYARAMGVYWDSSYVNNCQWWLRQTGSESSYPPEVTAGGSTRESGKTVDTDSNACVPALHIDLSSDLWSAADQENGGDGTENTPANPKYDTVTDTAKWDYVYFGSYPQIEVTGEELTAEIVDGEYDENGDAWVNNRKYRRVSVENPYYENNEYRYFQWRRIKWRVLKNDGKALFVMADSGLDYRKYHESYGAVDWENSTLREWLNHDFYNTAFDEKEQGAITEHYLQNRENPSYQISGGNNTKDNIYLLSVYEAADSDYGFNENVFANSESRCLQLTDYARAAGAGAEIGAWWLRTLGNENYKAAHVNESGCISLEGNDVDWDSGVCAPVLHIDLSSKYWYTEDDGKIGGNEEPDESVYIYFGSYPQTEVTGADLTAAITEAEFNKDGDAWIDGTKYRRIAKTDADYDEYFGDNEYRYFKWERIKWRVLQKDDSTLFVIADRGLDAKKYNEDSKDVTWESCTLREWLNGTFYHTAFCSDEQGAIMQQNVINENNPDYGTEGGKTTEDNIYLLSITEAESPEYGFGKDDDTSRQLQASDYAHAMGASTSTKSGREGNCLWWLRTPGSNTDCAAYVYASGKINRDGYNAGSPGGALVPVLHINPSSDVWFTEDDGTSGAGGGSEEPSEEPSENSSEGGSEEPSEEPSENSSEGGSEEPSEELSEKPGVGGTEEPSEGPDPGTNTPVNPVYDEKTDTTEWSYIYFGSYPQTEVTGADLTAAITGAEYDKNGDAWIDGTKYRRISKEDTNQGEYFGNNTYRYFKWERIRWRVLKNDGETLFVLADRGLDCQNYNDTYEEITWENATLREWLNKTFYHTAFCSDEQGAVVQQSVINESNPNSGEWGGNPTEDFVYLLSVTEAESSEYGFCKDGLVPSASRQIQASDYAHAMGASVFEGNYCWWWLRTPGFTADYASNVYDSEVDMDGYAVDRAYGSCVPALHIKLSSDLWLTKDDGTSGAGGGSEDEVKVTGITPSENNLNLKVGEIRNVSVTVAPSNATNKAVAYRSSNTAVATVTLDGAITAVAAGNATITIEAQDGSGVTATISVVVEKGGGTGDDDERMPYDPIYNENTDTTEWSYIYFGSYPQTEVTGSSLTEAITGASYDKAGDAWVNGSKYRRISKEDTNQDEYFGDSAYRYFKWERIRWRVLKNEGDTMFVMADLGLDCKNYHNTVTSVTWEDSALRDWLNGTFYNTAFGSGQQEAIVPWQVVNEDNPDYGTEGGNDTTDNVYLLSIGEAMDSRYGFCKDGDAASASRGMQPSDYSNAMGATRFEDADNNGHWWLRSPGINAQGASHIYPVGQIGTSGDNVRYVNMAVAPVLHIKSSSGFWYTRDDGTIRDLPENPKYDGATDTAAWSYIYFGSYPQTEVTGNDLTAAITGASYNSTGDAWVNGVKYRRIQKTDTNNDDYFGDSAYRYFKWERIRWRVLQNNGYSLFVMADLGLDCQKYHTVNTSVTWEKSAMRSWLNSTFYDMAFSGSEQDTVQEWMVVTEDNPYYDTPGGNITWDYIYLPSYDEMVSTEYGFGSDGQSVGRRMDVSDYAYVRGASISETYVGKCCWWLRSPGISSNGAMTVLTDGYIDTEDDSVIYNNVACVPVMNIDLSSKLWYAEDDGTSGAGGSLGNDTSGNQGGSTGENPGGNTGENPGGNSGGNTGNNPGGNGGGNIIGINNGNTGGGQKTPVQPVKLTAPRLTVKLKASNSVQLSWTKVNGASGYDIYRAVSKTGSYTKIKTVTTTSFLNKGLKKGKTYYYRVVARNGNTAGPNSNIASKKILGKLSKPVQNELAEASGSKLAISWKRIKNAQKIEIWRSVNSTSKKSYKKWKTVSAKKARAAYSYTGLASGKYYIKLRAYYKKDGVKVYSKYSNVRSFTRR